MAPYVVSFALLQVFSFFCVRFFFSFLSRDLAYLKLFKHHYFKLSRHFRIRYFVIQISWANTRASGVLKSERQYYSTALEMLRDEGY